MLPKYPLYYHQASIISPNRPYAQSHQPLPVVLGFTNKL